MNEAGAVALGSILLSPLMVRLGPALIPFAERLPEIARREAAQPGPESDAPALRRHGVICTDGRVGRTLGAALVRRGSLFTAIDINPAVMRDLRRNGVAAYYGDASVESFLRRAGVAEARTVAVTMPDLTAAMGAVRSVRGMRSGVHIITRANARTEVEFLRDAGADRVVQPEFEAGLVFIRFILREQGVSRRETETMLAWRRTLFYEERRESALSAEEAD